MNKKYATLPNSKADHQSGPLVFLIFVMAILGCSQEQETPKADSVSILKIPTVEPEESFRSILATRDERQFIAGETLRIETERKFSVDSPPERIVLQMRMNTQGKSVTFASGRFNNTGKGIYTCTIEIPKNAGEYDVLMKSKGSFIGRGRITVLAEAKDLL
ncbi:hypothetical protein FF011L_47230 [Roseimaritima multifibrata]|uniref:YtkA-like domain-containing protein n=1 Tax=Roseimaritima multifibrata TaxID=1930274 RepID=A0A517MM06_9BACT|nr:hypothetical protein [Roseimaritima multifibrata]QDS95922.1 hypothetical protein FF011L_47230 [Roseimaritima multifibrata]